MTACNLEFVQVSTHSRLKAAGVGGIAAAAVFHGFNTQPPEGGCSTSPTLTAKSFVSTHSRLKAAVAKRRNRFQTGQFQHTAA